MDLPLPRDAEGPVPPPPHSSSRSLSPPSKRRRSTTNTSDCCRTCRLRKVRVGFVILTQLSQDMAWHGMAWQAHFHALFRFSLIRHVCLHPCAYYSLPCSPQASSCYACSFRAISFHALTTNPAIFIPIRSNALATLGMDHVATVPD